MDVALGGHIHLHGGQMVKEWEIIEHFLKMHKQYLNNLQIRWFESLARKFKENDL